MALHIPRLINQSISSVADRHWLERKYASANTARAFEPVGVFQCKLFEADDRLGRHAGIHQGDRAIEFGKSPTLVNCFLGSQVVRIDVAQLDEMFDRPIPNSTTGRVVTG